MSNPRITSPDENIREEDQEITDTEEVTEEKPQTKYGQEVPQDYKNVFDIKEMQSPISHYPIVFTDIDFELKQNPRLFAGFSNLKVNPDTESKSEIERLWMYNRWKTWLYLIAQPTERIIVNKQETEKAGTYQTAQVNGVTYYIIKNMYVYVPKDIAKLITDSQNQTDMAGHRSLIDSLANKLDPETGQPKDPMRLER